MKKSLYLSAILFLIGVQSFCQNKKKTIEYDSKANQTLLQKYFISDSVILSDHWEITKKVKSKIPVDYHFVGLKNKNKDFIEIGIRRKKDNQFYINNIENLDLLKKDAEFEEYRYNVNHKSFQKIHTDATCYVFTFNKDKMNIIALNGIKNDFFVELLLYADSEEDRNKNLDYLITLFKNLKIK